MIRIVEGLYLGNVESARDRDRLKEAGVTHVVNCTEELPNFHEGEFTYLALKLADPDPRMHRCFQAVCAFIDKARRKQGGVLVHCYAAVSRSPAIVLMYLCHRGDTLATAARRLGGIVWTAPDWLFLAQLARHLGHKFTDRDLLRLSCLLQGRPGE